MSSIDQAGADLGAAIAIIGMAGRFPGARDVEAFWSNLRDGVHSVTFYTDDELRAQGLDPRVLADPSFVKAGARLEDPDRFDSAFFGFTPREADVLDPQHRVFLETAWAALENAGYDPGAGTIGVYAGSPSNDYLSHVLARPDLVEALGAFQLTLANGRDYLATHAAHRMNLRGPAVNVHTACSTGLVAVHVACQALANGECDMALAGGVAIRVGPSGYRHTPGGLTSPDGYLRAFSADAGGLVGGEGAGLVVLKRLAEALADGDAIRAVIRGSAINNDGAQKVGFTAPSVEGQAAVIEEALGVADVDPATVGYVEAHGSGTSLGDPVEVAALTQAFGDTGRTQFCALGSVKTNVGHLDAAAGATGLIKATLAVERGEIPPSLHFSAPNPEIPFASSPFFVNTALRPWPGAEAGGAPRRAGVSSFGIGGTNAHVVLEQAPARRPSRPARDWQLLPLSARTPEALEASAHRMIEHLRAHPEQPLCDVAWTLQAGRRAWEYRGAVVARTSAEAADALESRAPDRVFTGTAPEGGNRVAFLFPGLGSHYPGMGRGLYATEPVFRETVDRCAEILRPHLGLDLRELLYPAEGQEDERGGASPHIDLRALLGRASAAPDDPGAGLNATRVAQPALFVTEYALARLWMSWGVRPAAMVGHSLGEYVAATVAGVWSLEDALLLTAERARIVAELPPGGMMGVNLPPDQVQEYLGGNLDIGALNGPSITVFSGPVDELEAVQAEMEARGIVWRRLPLQHAFHSRMMNPVAERVAELLRSVQLRAPSLPFASSVTGKWITAGQATDPSYWSRHLVSTVRFGEGVETLAGAGIRVLLETGPGHGLRMLASQLDVWGDTPPTVVASMRHAYEHQPDSAHLFGSAGRLWAAGVPIDWEAVHAHERLNRVPLPTYPFERRRHWVDRPVGGVGASAASSAGGLYVPAWRRAPLAAPASAEPTRGLVLADEGGLGARLAERLRARGHSVAVATPGDGFRRLPDDAYTVRPGSASDLAALREALAAAGGRPAHVVQTWGIGSADETAEDADRAHARGYASVAALAAAFAADSPDPLRITVVTEGAQDVAGGEAVDPARATVLGACAVMAREHPHATCRAVDVRPRPGGEARLADQLLAEITAGAEDGEAALRGSARWVRSWEPAPAVEDGAGLRAGGAYLFTGVLTATTGALVEHLGVALGARVALVMDPALPERDAWDAYLASASPHGPMAHTLAWLRAAEARGVAPLLLRAPLDDADALRAALARARDAFGALHGIVHAPMLGAAAEYAPLATGTAPGAAAELDRLDRELSALRAAADGLELDFVLLQSSVVAAGGSGMGGAAAAYALVDAWGQRAAADGAPWTSIGWDRWRADAEADGAGEGISPADGLRAFGRLGAMGGEGRVVATARHPALRGARPASASGDGDAAELHPRPAMAGTYDPPETPAEEQLALLWTELFGIRDIGVRDDFFQLGGHSLLGMQLVSRIRGRFGVELPLAAVFDAPNIRTLAAVLDEALLAEVDGMTDEEVERALAEIGGDEEAAAAAASPHRLLATMDDLSDEALDRLLAGGADAARIE